MKILIAYDGSACADAALHDLSRAGLPLEAEAVILSVADVWMPQNPSTTNSRLAANLQRRAALTREAIRAQAIQTVEDARSIAQHAYTRICSYFPDWQVEVDAVADSPAWGIIKKADDWKADLIIVGSHAYSTVSRPLLGSVSRRVLSTTGCNVRIARENTRPQGAPVRMLLGVVDSPETGAMVRTVAQRVWRPGSVAHLVAVRDLPLWGGALAREENEDLDARQCIRHMVHAAAEQLRATGLDVTTTIKEGDPRRVLVEEANAREAECIFLGVRRVRRVARFVFGSVAAAVATHARCSAEFIRPRDVFVSPVRDVFVSL